MSDILLKARLCYAECTKAEKRVADYVLAFPGEAMYQSISSLAALCNVGETSVLRFCRRVGAGGYQHMKLQLAQAIAAQGEAGTVSQATGSVSLDDTLESLMDKSHTALAQALEETRLHMQSGAIDAVVRRLCAAPHIHFYGVGGSMLTAMDAAALFQQISPNVHIASDLHQQLMSASLLTPGDAALFFSFSGATKDTLDIARRATQNGAFRVAVTRSAESRLSKACDVSLISGGREGPLQGGSVAGKIAQLYIVDVLYAQFFRVAHDEAAKRRALTSGAVAERLL